MASWSVVEEEARELAGVVRARLEKSKHHVMGTLRADGSPRLSGTEVTFRDGELVIGAMTGSVKSLDLRRDPRIAIHSATEDPPDPPRAGALIDVKLAGRAMELGSEGYHAFRLDVDEVVAINLGDPPDHLVIESWHQGRGLHTVRRR